MSDDENNWGNKKLEYYQKNKQESDSDYIEEENEAIRLQQKKFNKLKQTKILDSESEEEEKEDKTKEIRQPAFNLDSSEDEKETKETVAQEEIDDMIEEAKASLEEISGNLDPIVEILKSESLEIPKTFAYLKQCKDVKTLYTMLLLYYAHCAKINKITKHHPIVKKIHLTKLKVDEMKESDDRIFMHLDKLLKLIETKKIDEMDEEGEDFDDDMEDYEEEEEIEVNKNKKGLTSKTQDTAQSLIGNKHTRDFIKENEEKFNKLKEEKLKKDNKKKEKLQKEIDNKLEMGQRLANDKVLKSKGITRKRPRGRGNAKLNNRRKFEIKQKERKNMVKEYVGKPEVYGGESTGIRRDLIRSTKIR